MIAIGKLRARTARAAGDARANGQLSKSAHAQLCAGLITGAELGKARQVLRHARHLLDELQLEGATARQLGLARRAVRIAEELHAAAAAQLDAQTQLARPPARPRGPGRPPRRGPVDA